MKPVVICDYDPRWPDMFGDIRQHVARSLGGLAVSIEHVGSTAVPGCAAKPIIDIDVVVLPERVQQAIRKLASLGYVHRGNLGIEGREAFEPPPGGICHHLYLCPSDSSELARHLLFRDYLRAHPDQTRAYSSLKTSLAQAFGADRPAYAEAKTPFITGILARATRESGGTGIK